MEEAVQAGQLLRVERSQVQLGNETIKGLAFRKSCLALDSAAVASSRRGDLTAKQPTGSKSPSAESARMTHSYLGIRSPV